MLVAATQWRQQGLGLGLAWAQAPLSPSFPLALLGLSQAWSLEQLHFNFKGALPYCLTAYCLTAYCLALPLDFCLTPCSALLLTAFLPYYLTALLPPYCLTALLPYALLPYCLSYPLALQAHLIDRSDARPPNGDKATLAKCPRLHASAPKLR